MKRSVIERKLGRVDRALEKAVDAQETPGVVVLARKHRDGEWLEHAAVVGAATTRPEREPMQRTTLFDLASLTKPLVTSLAVLELVDEGRIDLDDPVAKHLPAFGARGKETVTVRHLLTHSSGLKPWRPYHELLMERERKKGERWIGTREARDWVIENVCRSALVHELGEAAVYGDLDFIALGAMVEDLRGTSLDRVFRDGVAARLRLADSLFLPLGESGPDLPPGERARFAATESCSWRGRVLRGEVHDPNAWVMGGVAGHAGLFATADDVLRTGVALLDVIHGRSEAFPRGLLEHFFTRQRIPEGSDWALGWDTPTAGASSSGTHFSAQSVGHLGFTGTSLWIDLEKELVVVMLANRIHPIVRRSRFDLRPRIHDLLVEAFEA